MKGGDTMSKYHSRKITKDGISYDSVREYHRWCELQLLERAGKITKLRRQVRFYLIPAHYEKIEVNGKIKRKCIEREVSYIADFTYYDENGEFVVEDAKGFKTKDFIIKRKLMLHVHGIRIVEV